jgi:hypothetical protein
MRRADPRRWSGRLRPALAGALLVAAGCAPHVVRLVELEPAVRETRYRSALAAREVRGAAVEADVVLWAEAPAGHRLAGADGRILIAGPDAFRLRVAALFGTALDLGARGDSLIAWVPSRRRALTLDATRDSVPVPRPGGFAFRTLAGAWRPPEDAWAHAAWRDTLLRVAWPEGDDSLAVAVGSDGLPAWASFTRADGSGVRVDYQAWDRSRGVAWPSRFAVEEHDGAFRIAWKAERIRFRSAGEPLRLAIAIPSSARPLSFAELRRMILGPS